MKRQHTKWKKIFTNHISDKKLISKMYKKLIQVSGQKKKKKVGQQQVEVESCSLSTLKLFYYNIMKN